MQIGTTGHNRHTYVERAWIGIHSTLPLSHNNIIIECARLDATARTMNMNLSVGWSVVSARVREMKNVENKSEGI